MNGVLAGSTSAGFERVRAAFEDNFRHRGEVGAAFAVYVDGRLVVDLQDAQRGIAPGQAVVLYDDDRVVGSATIEGTG